MSFDRRPTDSLELAARGGKRGSPEHRRCARLMTRRAGRPLDILLGHAQDRAAASQIGLTLVEPVPPADQGAGAVRRVELVSRERHVIDVPRGDVRSGRAARVVRRR